MKTPTRYKEIPTEFESRKFHHKQVKRHGMVCLYERWSTEIHDPSHHFEVVKLRNFEERTIESRTLEAAEVYPHSESWGTNGFTYSNRHDAEAKFADLTAN